MGPSGAPLGFPGQFLPVSLDAFLELGGVVRPPFLAGQFGAQGKLANGGPNVVDAVRF